MSRRFRFYLAAVVVATLMGLLAVWAAEMFAADRQVLQMRLRLALVLSRIDNISAPTDALGSATSLGTVSTRLRKAANQPELSNDPDVIELFSTVVGISGVEGAFVLNRDGRITNFYDKSNTKIVSAGLDDRPYFRSAMAGRPNVYLAYGRATKRRFVYVAAPIYASATSVNSPIGVFVVMVRFDVYDQILASAHESYALVSPENRVFSTNVPDLEFASLSGTGTFHNDFERLPSSPSATKVAKVEVLSHDRIRLPDGSIKRAIFADADFPDPQGKWQLAIFGDPNEGLALSDQIAIAFIAFAATMLLAFGFEFWRRRERQLLVAFAQEEELRHRQSQHAFMANVLNASSIAFHGCDQAGVVRDANTSFNQLFGVDESRVGEMKWARCFVHDSDYESLLTVLAEQGTVKLFECEMQRMDGSQFWALVTASLIQREDGTQMVAVWTVNISVHKSLQAQLVAALDVAEDATRMKSEFLANMSHEIRTPMNAILGMAQLTLKTRLDSRQFDYVEKILRAGRSLLGLINDILDFSKIEAGKLEIEETEFELAQVLRNITELVSDQATAKGLELVVNIDKEVPQLMVGDPLRLGQILLNYTNNAVKFTNAGEIEISLRVAEDRNPGDRESGSDSDSDGDSGGDSGGVLLKFAVKDTGIGMNPGQLSRVFQSFEQGDKSITRRYGGTGLGLAICKRLAELMHGEVGVESVPGRGSTFWFTALLKKSEKKARKLIAPSWLHGIRVLVVEDNATARSSLRDMLSRMMFHVAEASSGRQALESIRECHDAGTPFDVAVIDWQMPEMDGIEVVRRITAMNLSHPPKTVLITAYDRDDAFKGAKSVGITEVLVKPIQPSLMLDFVTELLSSNIDELDESVHLANREESQVHDIRVLLVEDNEINQEVAAGLLESRGVKVDIASDGLEAIEKLFDAPDGLYDAVFMDMQMPVMDGVAATMEIRKQARFANLPIIAMTANAMQQDRERCLEAGMNDHIAKPVDEAVMWEALGRWIRRPDVSRQPPEIQQDPGAEFQIEGIDTAAGLRRTRGDRVMYQKLLSRFVDGQAGIALTIRQALLDSDAGRAERDAHSLNGLAGTLGAMEVQKLARELEEAIRSGAPRKLIDEMIPRLQNLMEQTVHNIRGSLSEDKVTTQPTGSNVEAAREVALKILEMLKVGNAKAVTLFESFTPSLRAAYPPMFDAIAAAIEAYDFSYAAELLDAAMKTPTGSSGKNSSSND